MALHISDKVRRVLDGEHISDTELAEMVRTAAMCRVEGYSKRFFHWLFKVSGPEWNLIIEDMRYKDPVIVDGTGDTLVLDEHKACAGTGCRECGWWGSQGHMISDSVVDKLG